MKKILLMLTLLASVVVSATAQIATENSKLFDNVGVGITAGASTPLDFNSMFPVNPNVGLKVTKDITPVIGLQLEGLAVLNDNHFSDLKTVVKATNVGLNGALNLSNMLGGYNGTPRVFEISAVAGLGWLHSWNTSENSLTGKTGLDLALNVGKKKAHSFVLTPAIYWNLHKIDAIQFNKNGAQLALNLTYIYHFKTSNGTHHFKTYDVGAMIGEIDRLNEELAKKPTEVEVIKYVEKKVPDKVAVATDNGETWIVAFATGSAELTNEAKFILNQVGNDAIVDVTATASPDGPAVFNKRLSEKRAVNVANYLAKRGVRVNSWLGNGVDAEKGKTAVVKTLQ